MFTVSIEEHEDLNPESQHNDNEHDVSQGSQEEEKHEETICFVFGPLKNIGTESIESPPKCCELS